MPKIGKIYNVPNNESEGDFFVAEFKGGDHSNPKNWRKLSYAERVIEATTGNKWNEEDLPSLRDFMGSQDGMGRMAKLWPAMMMAGDQNKLKAAVQNNLPGFVEFVKDGNDEPIVVFKDSTGKSQRAYLNRPGFSAQDTSRMIGEVGALTGFGKLFGMGKAGIGIANNMLRAGGAGTSGSAAQDIAAGALSGEGPFESVLGVNPARALETGAFEAATLGAGELVMLAAPPLREMLSRGVAVFDKNQNLTKEAKRVFNELGIQYDQLTQKFKDELFKRVTSNSAIDAREAAVLAESQSLPVPIDQTKGSVTGLPGDQLQEDMMRKGVYGEEAATRMQEFDINQQQQIDDNLSEIQRLIAGDSPVINRGEGAAEAQSELARLRIRDKKKVDQTYGLARARGQEARYSTEALRTLTNRIRSVWDTNYTKSVTESGPVLELFRELEALTLPDALPTVRQIFEWRQKTQNAAPFGTPESKALKDARTQLDQQLANDLDGTLFQGSDEAVMAWRDAISKNAEFKRTWESKDLTQKLTDPVEGAAFDELSLKVAPEEAANFIFGSSNLGFISKKNLQRDLLKLKKLLPADQFNQLRQELFLRLMAGGKSAKSGQMQLSGAKLSSAIADVTERNSSLLNAVFTGEENKLLRQFARAADRAQNTAKNRSNTAVSNAKNLSDLMANVTRVFRFAPQQVDRLLLLMPLGLENLASKRATMGLESRLNYQGSPSRLGPEIPAVGTAVATEEEQQYGVQ